MTIIVLMVALAVPLGAQEAGTAAAAPQVPPELITAPDNPVLLVFTATWCGPCHRMRETVFRDPEVAPLLRKYNVAMLDVDTPAGAALARRYCREGVVPYYIILDVSRDRVAEQIGGSDAGTFAAFLRQGLKVDFGDVSGGIVDSRRALGPHWSFGVSGGALVGWFGQATARLKWYNGNFLDTGVYYSSVFGIGVPADFNFRVAGPFSMGLGISPALCPGGFDIAARGRADLTFGDFSVGAIAGLGLVNQNRGDIVNTRHNLFAGVSLTLLLW